MAAYNKPPAYVSHLAGGPIFLDLPVQAGSTQEIKLGEICKLRDPTDIASYPIIPVSDNDMDAILLVAWEEQDSAKIARVMKFMLWDPLTEVCFNLDAATAVKIGADLEIHDSQTLKQASTYAVAAATRVRYTAAGVAQTISEVWAVPNKVYAASLQDFPFVGTGQANATS